MGFEGGYAGKILVVDLSSDEIREEDLDEKLARDFLGGYGINLGLAARFLPKGVGPLSPGNVIIIGSGPLVGSLAPSSAKSAVLTRYPQTGAVVCGTTGGSLGPMLKWAGYDNLVIIGKSEKPVYLKIRDSEVEIHDAEFLWGQDVYRTTDMLWEKEGYRNSVMAIGPSGERGISITLALIDKVSHIGKGGLGAVMGSKNLKAITVYGTRGLRLANAKGFAKLSRQIGKGIVQDPFRELGIKYGSMLGFDAWADAGISTHNSSSILAKDEAVDLFGPEVYLKHGKKASLACISCLCCCKDHIELAEGDFQGLETFVSSSYGRCFHWGGRCLVGNYNNIMRCQDLANRYGLDAHGLTAVIDWAIDLYKKGIISQSDTGGIKLEYGLDSTLTLIEMIARNEGLGAILGKGFKGAIKELGSTAGDLAMQIKGMDCQWDPRLTRMGTPDFHQIVNPKGPFGSTGASAAYLMRDRPVSEFVNWCQSVGLEQPTMEKIFDRWPNPRKFNVGKLTVHAENWWALCNSLGAGCGRPRVSKYYNLDIFVKLYKMATGSEVTGEDMRASGERSYNLLKLLNVREGFSRKDDAPPQRWFEPLITSEKTYVLEDYFGEPISKEALGKLLDDYYEERGWNVEMGVPNSDKISSLALDLM
jgi:aldehyde:ferredoxin oxidoreductase